MRKKRGQYANIELWFLLAAFLLGAVAGIDLLKDAKDRLDGTLFEKNFIARDLAMALEALYASPGDMAYTYDFGPYKFLVEVKDNEVLVKEKAAETSPVSYRVIGNSFSDQNYVSFDNPEGYKIRRPNMRMVSIIDEAKPVKLRLFKEFSDNGTSIVGVEAENAQTCLIGVNCADFGG
ncbi:hypothetical protein J4470_01080 [Candidatus Woesearchaeota archaeon]|nr:hypothetical protein [Candidatus Woesearchaeota archaeon]